MTAIDAFRDLLMSLTEVYSGENRDGARAVVAALRAGAKDKPPSPQAPFAMNSVILAASESAWHPAAVAARAAHPLLPWSRTGILDAQIGEDVSSVFAVATLVGPGALIHSEAVRGGLFVMRSGASYPAHAHAAEETYAMLAGSAEWQRDLGAWQRRVPGDLIHHPSNASHATRTGALPILAAWRWSGDISPESYRMVQPG